MFFLDHGRLDRRAPAAQGKHKADPHKYKNYNPHRKERQELRPQRNRGQNMHRKNAIPHRAGKPLKQAFGERVAPRCACQHHCGTDQRPFKQICGGKDNRLVCSQELQRGYRQARDDYQKQTDKQDSFNRTRKALFLRVDHTVAYGQEVRNQNYRLRTNRKHHPELLDRVENEIRNIHIVKIVTHGFSTKKKAPNESGLLHTLRRYWLRC